jgi:hypothetical protein
VPIEGGIRGYSIIDLGLKTSIFAPFLEVVLEEKARKSMYEKVVYICTFFNMTF